MNYDLIITSSYNMNKNASLLLTLRSILAQTFLPKSIIVSENNNFLKTKKLIKEEFGNFITVVNATKKFKNISYCRNTGFYNTSEQSIVFMDDDVIINNCNTLEHVIKSLKYYDFTCGAIRLWSQFNWQDFIKENYHINHIVNILNSNSINTMSIDRINGEFTINDRSFIGHFGAIKRNVFKDIGGFDEQYEGWGYQDTDLMMRLCYKNYKYYLMSQDNISIIHLSHVANKYDDKQKNKELYDLKLKNLNLLFNLNNFFAYYTNNNYDLFTPQ